MTNVAFRYEIIVNQLSSTLQIRDLFSTGEFEYTAEGQNFYSYRHSTRESPLVMLNLRFNLNNYKQQRQPGREQGGVGDEDEF
jgi:hypothetical protein